MMAIACANRIQPFLEEEESPTAFRVRYPWLFHHAVEILMNFVHFECRHNQGRTMITGPIYSESQLWCSRRVTLFLQHREFRERNQAEFHGLIKGFSDKLCRCMACRYLHWGDSRVSTQDQQTRRILEEYNRSSEFWL